MPCAHRTVIELTGVHLSAEDHRFFTRLRTRDQPECDSTPFLRGMRIESDTGAYRLIKQGDRQCVMGFRPAGLQSITLSAEGSSLKQVYLSHMQRGVASGSFLFLAPQNH